MAKSASYSCREPKLVPRIHTVVAHDHLELQLQGSDAFFWLLQVPAPRHTQIIIKKKNTENKFLAKRLRNLPLPLVVVTALPNPVLYASV